MKKALPLLACLLCLTAMGCKPEHAARDLMRGQRMEERGERGDREHRGLRKACRSEIEQYCAADQTNRDRRECLQNHMDKLSADCKTAVVERMNRHGGGRRNRDGDNGATNNNGGATTNGTANTNGANNKDDDDN